MSASASRIVIALALAGVVAAGATACGSEPDAVPSSSSTPTPTVSATPTATGTPTAEPDPGSGSDMDGIPVTIDCNELITPQAIYDYNPNYSLNESYAPADGTEAARIAKLDGLTCSWVNQTSGASFDVAVAQLPGADLTTLKNELATTSAPVPTYTVEGYFAVVGTTGQADAFDGAYWVSATSVDFYEAGDAAPLIAAAISGLG